MGIHSGPVNEITDLNAQSHIAGAGITLPSASWIAVMPATFCCPSMWRMI